MRIRKRVQHHKTQMSKALAVLALFVVGCDKDVSKSPPILLITMDTTRADRLGCYGYGSAHTPNLDKLAQRGILFESAYTPTPLTLPAHASLHLGVYPNRHGVRDNGLSHVGVDRPTLATFLSERGYRCHAVVASAVLDDLFGLDRGFLTYDDGDFLAGKGDGRAERPADEVTALALNHVQSDDDRPLFLWVHYFDPHFPYISHGAFQSTGQEAYDQEIAFMDQQIGHVVDAIERRFPNNQALIMAIADHGEDFYEHGEKEHGFFLYDTTVKVPWIMAGAGLPMGTRVSEVVSLVDVFPTVASLFGEEVPDSDGISRLDQESSPTNPRRDVYLESFHPHLSYGWSWLKGIRSGTNAWKYVDAPKEELYNLLEDPNEKINRFGLDDLITEDLKNRLSEFVENDSDFSASSVNNSEALEDALEALGYTIARDSKVSLEERGPDPKVAYSSLDRYREGRIALQQGRIDEALSLFEEFIRACPRRGKPTQYVGTMLATVGSRWISMDGRRVQARRMFTEAIPFLTEAVAAMPHLADLHFQLAVSMRESSAESSRARYSEELERLLERHPSHLSAIDALARFHDRQGNGSDALGHYKDLIENSALDQRPITLWAYYRAGQLSVDLGELSEARRLFELLRDLAPESSAPYWGLFLWAKASDSTQALGYLKSCRERFDESNPSIDPSLTKSQIAEAIDLILE